MVYRGLPPKKIRCAVAEQRGGEAEATLAVMDAALCLRHVLATLIESSQTSFTAILKIFCKVSKFKRPEESTPFGF